MQHSNMGGVGVVAGRVWLSDLGTKFLAGVILRKQFSAFICEVAAPLGGGAVSPAAGHPLVCPASAQRDFRGKVGHCSPWESVSAA